MPIVPISREKRRAAKGSALVIVLFFVALLSIVTIAFLSRSMTAVKVSAGSAGETKSRILASSASDIIVGDLKQEIAAGSTLASSDARWPVYLPTSNLTMIPFQNGVPLLGSPATNAIPNMISRSVSPVNTSGSAPYVGYPVGYYTATTVPPNRAASDPSAASPTITVTTSPYSYTTTSKVNSAYASLNGRYISPVQWNSHYLIPRLVNAAEGIPGSTNVDSTPTTNFVAPDWVIITRGGANSVTWSSTALTGLTDPIISNTNYAIGRYAYAVYNEGGLLDMNAAGYPADTNMVTASVPPFNVEGPNGLTAMQISQKGSLALADLTQLSAGTTNLIQGQVNNIVGWRNYASAELTSANTFGNFKFTSQTASYWLTNFVMTPSISANTTNFFMGNTNGFMQIVPTAAGVTTPPTDQALLSRQQLISVTQSLGISPDYLQYMGTFSRGLEQPSTAPDSTRPLIINGPYNAVTDPPLSTNVDNYLGNNDNVGADNTVNPSFLSVRVSTTFTRLNGSAAIFGEPLVKTKFPLSWLSLVTYNYSAYNATAAAAASDPVYQRFGIYKTGEGAPWTYNHGQNSIMTLSQVAAAGREPDFAELLKAAIIAGSVAKAGPNLNNGSGNYQYTLDVASDYQILQIMANLIDQQDSDSYPTVIQIQAPSGTYYRAFYGIEDLPYFYRYHVVSVVDQTPSPLISRNASVTFPATNSTTSFTVLGSTSTGQSTLGGASTTATSWNATPSTNTLTCNGMQLGTVTTPGDTTYLYVPDLWNPHDMNTLATSTTSRPAQFRIYATTDDPVALTPAWAIGTQTAYSASSTMVPTVAGGIYVCPTSTQAQLTTANTAMTFTDNGGKLFREPTMLWNTNSATGPTGLALTSTGTVKEVNTGKVFAGIIAGHSAISQTVTYVSTPAKPTDGTYIIQGNSQINTWNSAVNAFQQITFFLQYQDPNNSANWISYDVKYPDLHGLNPPSLVVNTADYPNGLYYNSTQNGQVGDQAATRDPRTARWGVGTQSKLGEVSLGTAGQGNTAATSFPFQPNPWVLEPTANADFNLGTSAANQAVGNFSVLETNRPRGDKGDQTNYSNSGMTSNPGKNLQMRIFSGVGWSASNGVNTSPLEFDGLTAQNDSTVLFTAKDNATTAQNYFEDPDGIDRRAMGAFAFNSTSLLDTITNTPVAQPPATTPNRIGQPLATANTFNDNAVATATAQSQSRPMILNRPFRSVSEMSYAFRGTPWENIDFFTPESGDSALLDTFCLVPPPSNAMVAGKVDLNTRQIPVLQAIVAGAYRDEFNNVASPPSYALPPLSGTEANNVAATVEAITSDTTHAWHGPFKNVSGLVGRFVPNFVPTASNTNGYSDFYNYVPPSPVTGQVTSVTYAGLSSALDCTAFNGVANHVYSNTTNSASSVAPYVQRFRESALRPLVDSGQVRVWNLLIDVVAQTGHYPKTATGIDQFLVDGQTRLWVHVAIDRYTGQVIDKQVEVVTP